MSRWIWMGLWAGMVWAGPVVQCHRVASRYVPENTLLAMEEGKRLGCEVVEVDIRRSLDGELVMLHDAVIDRHSAGSGAAAEMYGAELGLYDAGAWMHPGFAGMRHARFGEVLRRARELDLGLLLDLKDAAAEGEVMAMVRAEGMEKRVRFVGGGRAKAGTVKAINSRPTRDWKRGVTAAEVARWKAEGLFVAASFQDDGTEMDLGLMKEAVAAGVDLINTDRPRLVAEALGRPVEARLGALIAAAAEGSGVERGRRVLAVAEWRSFPLRGYLAGLVGDGDAAVSRAAAVGLARRGERGLAGVLRARLQADSAAPAWANAVWAVGMTGGGAGSAELFRAALGRPEVAVRREVWAAVSRVGGLPLAVAGEAMGDGDPLVRGWAAMAWVRLGGGEAEVRRAAERLRGELAAGVTEEGRRGYQKMVAALGALAGSGGLGEAVTGAADYNVMGAGWTAAYQFRERPGVAELLGKLDDADPRVRNMAQTALELSEEEGVDAALAGVTGSAERRRRAEEIRAWRARVRALW